MIGTSEQITDEVVKCKGVEENAICPTHLIEDAPSEEDLFASNNEIGPHERVAIGIADTILSHDETGGKMIALEGTWGSGKTTVIRLLEKRLSENSGIATFLYDAWAHEGDPLRRTFLESLVRYFRDLKWIDKENADKVLDTLSNRRKVIKTTTIPKVTNLGKKFALSVLLVPIGGPLLAVALEQLFIKEPPKINWPLLVAGTICVLAPFVVLSVNKIIKTLRTGTGRRDIDDWAFIGSDSIHQTEQETIETPQPTSIEFQELFCKVMDEALDVSCNRKMVMVLDNLDRVDARDALTIWSTLQTFFQCRDDRPDGWFKKLWVVIPYDPAGLRKLWANKSNDNTTSASIKDIVPESFMDKSFLLRFTVPPPMLSNWKAYLEMLISKSLPQHQDQDQHKIYQIYRLNVREDERAPTPRELIIYVNQIGVIHRQWQHKFPLDHIAYYVALCRKDASKVKDLLETKKIPDETIQDLLTSKFTDNLPGLYFNVTPDLGQQLLLKDPIELALHTGDAAELKKLERTHQDGFWAVLESIMTEGLRGVSALEISDTALCLDSSGILAGRTGADKAAILQGLRRTASRMQSWAPFNGTVAKGLAALLRLISDHTYSETVLTNLRDTIAKGPADEETITGLAHICEEVTKLDHQDALRPFTLPGTALEWTVFCSNIYKQGELARRMFRPQIDFNTISTHINSVVAQGGPLRGILEVIEVTDWSFPECDWSSVTSSLQGRLGDPGQTPTNEEINFILQAFYLLIKVGCTQARSSLDSLAASGLLMHWLHQSHSQGHKECTARLLSAFLELKPGAGKPPTIGNSDAGFSALVNLLATDNTELAREVLEILREENKENYLFSVVDSKSAYDPLIVRCLRILADEAPERLFTAEVILRRWSELWDHLNEDGNGDRFDKLIGYLSSHASLAEIVQNAEGGFNYEDAWLYFRICEVTQSGSFQEWCRNGLDTLTSANWKSALEDDDNLFCLLLFFAKKTGIALRYPYSDALVEHSREMLAGKKPAQDRIADWPAILSCLSPTNRDALPKRLLNEAFRLEGKCAEVFFQIYGDELATHLATYNGIKEVVEKLFSPLLRQRNLPGLQWLSGVLQKHPNLLNKSLKTSEVVDFLERVKGEGQKLPKDSDVWTVVMDIARALRIPEDPVEDAQEVVLDEKQPKRP